VGPPEVSLLQGTSGSTRVLLSRADYSGPVGLSMEGQVPGLTLALSASSITGNVATLTATATLGLAPGQYPVTVRATPLPTVIAGESGGGGRANLEETVASLTVLVHQRTAGVGNVTLDWNGCFGPSWVAYQDGNGPWIQVLGVANRFSFPISSPTGGYAYVLGNTLVVSYARQVELTAGIGFCPAPPPPARTITGVAVHLGTLDGAFNWRLGGATTNSFLNAPDINLFSVRPGIHDLIGWGSPTGVGLRMLIRRDVDLPHEGSLGSVALGSEGFAPIRPVLTVTGAAGETVVHTMSYLTTSACSEALLYTSPASAADPNNQLMSGVPTPLQRATDFHLLSIVGTGATTRRTRTLVFQTMGGFSQAMPPALPIPAMTRLPASFHRLGATLPSVPAAYTGRLTLEYGTAPFIIRVTSTLHTPPEQTSLSVPELSGVSGWPAASILSNTMTVPWTVTAETPTPVQRCTEGAITMSASRMGGSQGQNP
jgi:hypothetical protein